MKRFLTAILMITALNFTAYGQGLEIFNDMQELIISVSESVKPTVVHIEVVKKYNTSRYESLGSGLIVSEDGYIITNEHVIDKYVSVIVTLESKLEYPAEVIGVDKLTDIALIKIIPPEDETLKTAKFGNSDSVKVGEWVLAVGNPYGFDRTVSFGIVSGKGRTLNFPSDNAPLLNNFIQTDAAIDPGSSGGPLVNLRGEVIGINSIGVGRMQGFTIPINIVIDVMEKLKTGAVERGYVGIVVQPLNRSYAKFYKQPDLQGVITVDVFDDHPADNAGLKVGDIITSFGGNPVSAENDDDLNKFILDISQSKISEKKAVEIIRDGKKRTINIKIGQKPKVKPDEFETELDFTVEEITEHMFRRFLLETREGVYVRFVEVGSPGDKGDLMAGDIITMVGDKKIKTLDDFKKAIKQAGKPDFLLLKVMRGKQNAFALLDFTDSEKDSGNAKDE